MTKKIDKQEQIDEVLELHHKYIKGARADLAGADLSEADLRGADLREADLSGADMWIADLTDIKIDHRR